MNAEKTNRTKLLQVRLTPGEFEKINATFSKSTFRKLSDYVRKKLLDKPIAIYQRNQSLDDFMAEMIALRQELNAIGINYNQVAKKLNSVQQNDEIKAWAIINESGRQNLFQKIEEIKLKISQINDQWLR
jgi:hypothetical protein